jgi:type I restriction enzyme M protein
MADGLRGHMDAAEYKHVALGLIFLKYISDAFAERYEELQAEVDEGADHHQQQDLLGRVYEYFPASSPAAQRSTGSSRSRPGWRR